MNETWTYSKVSTPERCLEKISNELPRPVGIVIFGTDKALKSRVEWLCAQKIPHLVGCMFDEHSGFILRRSSEEFREERNVVMTLNDDESCDHRLRHQIITSLRNSGIKSVVGLYVESALMDMPTADGLEALITVSKEVIS